MSVQNPSQTQSTRRSFLKTSTLAGGAAAVAVATHAHAAEDNTIKVALVGCGGRGTGAAANALRTSGPTKLVACADVFPERMKSSLDNLTKAFGAKIDVPAERQFIGLDAYRKAIGCLDKTDLVILATPPAFRPIHFEYAVAQGRNVFMEKSFGVDAPGVRRVLAAGLVAQQKNLKVAGGLMWRHDPERQAVIQRIHDGMIGDVVMLRTYRMHGAVGMSPRRPGMSELAYQISNYNNFTWLGASFFVDWLIHNIDICCWAKNALPVAAQGHGGRCSRTVADQMFDHYAVEYIFQDGTRLFAQGRHVDKTWGTFADYADGSKGSAIIMTNLSEAQPRIYKSHAMTKENEVWRWEGDAPDPYQIEHDLLFDAIRNNKPYNESDRCAKAALVAIMGRMAAHSGQLVTYDQALKSDFELAPGLETYTWDSNPPAMPDAQGRYPISIPGQTKEF